METVQHVLQAPGSVGIQEVMRKWEGLLSTSYFCFSVTLHICSQWQELWMNVSVICCWTLESEWLTNNPISCDLLHGGWRENELPWPVIQRQINRCSHDAPVQLAFAEREAIGCRLLYCTTIPMNSFVNVSGVTSYPENLSFETQCKIMAWQWLEDVLEDSVFIHQLSFLCRYSADNVYWVKYYLCSNLWCTSSRSVLIFLIVQSPFINDPL